MFLKQSTASQSVIIGPFVDKTDGNTQETGLTIANTDIRLSKNGGNLAAKTSGGGTHDEEGWYTITLDATDTNTVGRLQLFCHIQADALPVYHEFDVVEEAVYVDMFASSAAGYAGITEMAAAQTDLDTLTAGVTLAAGAVTDASLAGGLEIVFETDFATNYNTTRNAWATNYTDTIGTHGAVASVTAGVTLANGAVTDASLAGNMEIVYETDFATNYNVTRNAWETNVQDFVGTSAADPFNGKVVAASVTGAVGSVTGHTNQTGDTYALANGAAGFVAIDTVVDAIKVITDALTAAAAAQLALSAAGIIGGATSGTPTTTASNTDLTGYLNDELIGRTIIFTGGTANGQASDITDYVATSGVVTYTAITTAPAASDTFVIV